jgi:hypothetical protein
MMLSVTITGDTVSDIAAQAHALANDVLNTPPAAEAPPKTAKAPAAKADKKEKPAPYTVYDIDGDESLCTTAEDFVETFCDLMCECENLEDLEKLCGNNTDSTSRVAKEKNDDARTEIKKVLDEVRARMAEDAQEPEEAEESEESAEAESSEENEEEENEEDGDAPSAEDVRDAVMKVMNEVGMDSAEKIVKKFKVAKIAELKPDQYADVIAETERVLAAEATKGKKGKKK